MGGCVASHNPRLKSKAECSRRSVFKCPGKASSLLFPEGSVTFLFPGDPAIDWNCVRNRGGVEGTV